MRPGDRICYSLLKELRETDEVLARCNVSSQRFVLKRLWNVFMRVYTKEGGKPRFKGLNHKIRFTFGEFRSVVS